MKRESLIISNSASSCYEAPAAYVVEVSVERGFEVSGEGFGLGDGTSYDEENVIW